MIANCIKPVFAALAVFSALAATTQADAGDRSGNRWGDRGHGYHRVENSRADRHGDGRRNRPAEIDRMTASRQGAGEPESLAENLNAYGGSITAYTFGRNGIYFDRDDWLERIERPTLVLAPKAKVIHVGKGFQGTAFDPVSACAFEMGVCVIRGN